MQSPTSSRYFCHYNNAIYMGGMSAFKKHGLGLLLHDDGSCIIADHLHDTPSGQWIILRENSIISILYRNGVQEQVAYRMNRQVILVRMQDRQPHGRGALIDYDTRKIYILEFRRGVLARKILELDRSKNEEVFHKNNISRVIGLQHEQAFNFTFQKPVGCQI